MMVRSALGEQLAALSATPARVPVHADAGALFPSTAPIANLVAWSKTAAPKVWKPVLPAARLQALAHLCPCLFLLVPFCRMLACLYPAVRQPSQQGQRRRTLLPVAPPWAQSREMTPLTLILTVVALQGRLLLLHPSSTACRLTNWSGCGFKPPFTAQCLKAQVVQCHRQHQARLRQRLFAAVVFTWWLVVVCVVQHRVGSSTRVGAFRVPSAPFVCETVPHQVCLHSRRCGVGGVR